MKAIFLPIFLLFASAFSITVDAKPTPIINFSNPSPSVLNTSSIGTLLSVVTVTMSDGSSYGSGVSFTAPGNNSNGVCALSSISTNPANLNVGKALTAGQYTCTIKATKQGVTVSRNITITVTTAATPTPSVSFNPSAPTYPSTKAVGSILSQINVMMSDGSSFNGSLAFGSPNSNDGGTCAISGFNLTLGKAFPSGSSSHSCTVIATQGSKTSSPANITITVVGLPTPSVIFNPTSKTVPDTTAIGTYLTTIATTMSDGSVFYGSLTLSDTGGGACALAGTGPTLAAPTTVTLTNVDGVWSFGTFVDARGYRLLRNGVDTGGIALLYLSYNNHTYVKNDNYWYLWGGTFTQLAGDPRPSAPTIITAKTLTAGTYTCTVLATTQDSATGSNSITITSNAAATPTVVLNQASKSVYDNITIGTPLSVVSVTMSDGSSFTGTLAVSGTYCALSSTSVPSNLTLKVALPAGSSTQSCSVIATQGAQVSPTATFTLNIIGPSPTVSFGTSPVSIPSSASIGTTMSSIITTMSDGSVFTGTLAFGAPNGNGTGVCAISIGGSTITNTSGGTLTTSAGTWSYGTNSNGFGNQILLNGVGAGGGYSTLLLAYNDQMYTYTQNNNIWYQWNGSGWPQINGDPRVGQPSGSRITVGKVLTAGSYNCSVIGTQNGIASLAANLAITVTGAGTPTLVFTPSSTTVSNTLAPGQSLSTMSVTMSDGSTFSGTYAFGGTYGNGGGICAISGNQLVVGSQPLVIGTQHCSVVATQGATSDDADLTIIVTGTTLSINFTPPTPTIPDTTAINGFISAVSVTVSDGSGFIGSLTFGAPYFDGNGFCKLVSGSGSTITNTSGGTLTTSAGTWSYGVLTNQYGNQILLNGSPASGGYSTLLLAFNNQMYTYTSSNNIWYQWSGTDWPQIAGDPRTGGGGSGNNVILGKILSGASTQMCTVVATQ